MIRTRTAGLACLLVIALVLVVARRPWQRGADLNARLGTLKGVSAEREIACSGLSTARPVVLLALGQSNAGNHGAAEPSRLAPVKLVAEGRCVLATDPLPGATGTGGSIWRRLPDALARQGMMRPVVLSVLAVDATSIDDWTRAGSPLRHRLETRVSELRKLGLLPSLVLWQQGERDALSGISAKDYANGLAALVEILTAAGIDVPLLLARSTVCRSPPSGPIRTAIELAPTWSLRLRVGPDTDSLQQPSHRIDGCHFSAEGLNAAAELWSERITAELTTRSSDPTRRPLPGSTANPP